MAELGTMKVNVEPVLSGAFAIVVAATQLHDALYHDPETCRALPPNVMKAYGDLQHALRAVTRGGNGR